MWGDTAFAFHGAADWEGEHRTGLSETFWRGLQFERQDASTPLFSWRVGVGVFAPAVGSLTQVTMLTVEFTLQPRSLIISE